MTTPEAPAQPDLLPPKPRTVYKVMWQVKRSVAGNWTDAEMLVNWIALEEEVWSSPEWAEARLKHYQKSTLSRVLEFRVFFVQEESEQL